MKLNPCITITQAHVPWSPCSPRRKATTGRSPWATAGESPQQQRRLSTAIKIDIFFFFLEKEENQMMSSLDFYDTHNNHFIENTSVTEPRDTMSCWQHAASQPPAWSRITVLSSHHKPRTCVHAKSLQSCPTLCDPIDYSSISSSVHGILQAKILECVAHVLLQGIFLIQGSNTHFLCLLHCPAGSLLLHRLGSLSLVCTISNDGFVVLQSHRHTPKMHCHTRGFLLSASWC